MKIFSFRGDGWYPKLSADGQYVAFGGGGIPSQGTPPMVSVVHIQTGRRALHQPGRAIRWMGPMEVCWLVEDGPLRDVMWGAQIVSPDVAIIVQTPYDPGLVAANDFAATDGHWASWLAHGKRLVIDGQVFPGEYDRGVEMNGRYLLTVRADNRFIVLLDGAEWRNYPLPDRANSWTISREGFIGYGYYWPSRVITPAWRDIHVTAAQWAEESVPLIVHVGALPMPWLWTHTVRPSDRRSLMCGRPLPDRDVAPGEQPCIVIPDFPADSFDAVCVDDRWIIAGFSGTGDLAVHAVSLHQTRDVVRDGTVPDPLPDPSDPPEVPPMAAPNRFDVVNNLNGRLQPNLHDGAAGDRFTAQVAATLHFGSPSLGIAPDANWGRRRNPSGVLSNDVLCYRASGETFDICVGMGGSNPQLGWNASTPGEWVAPSSGDVVGGGSTPPPNPDPPPTGDLGAVVGALNAIHATLQRLSSHLGA
jgi:hypothetical protein